ncbi:MAG TPA: hypothetical protein VM734_35145 [Kofleriaceae bacterium]|jgi:hypothetical protein|nr:hypothetical protein [Kofleriaceae bacterium]
MTDLEQRLNELVSSFVNDISKLARQAALDTLSQALAGVGGTVITDLRLPGGRRGRGKAVLAAGRRPKGAKRAPEEIEQLKEQVHAHIKEHPGERIEQINAHLGTSTAELSLPLKKLISDGAVRTEGDRRATKYFPGEGTPRATGRKRRKKKD